MAYACQLYQRLVTAHWVMSEVTYLLQRIQWTGLRYLERRPIEQEQVEDLVWFVDFLNGIEQALCRLASPPQEGIDDLAKFAARFQRERDAKLIRLVPARPGQSPELIVVFLKEGTQALRLYSRLAVPPAEMADKEICAWLDLVRGLNSNVWR